MAEIGDSEWEGGCGGGRGVGLSWACNAGGKGVCKGKKHLGALEHQEALRSEDWESYGSREKGQ